MGNRTPKSPFAERLETFAYHWAAILPSEHRAAFIGQATSFIQENESSIDTLKRIMDRLEAAHNRDPLTNLPNRHLMLAGLEALLMGGHHPDTTAIGVIFVDMDKFKGINDVHGHAAGDKALSCVARIIRRSIKSSHDTMERLPEEPERADGGRLGGDEFLVVVELRDIRDFHAVARRLHEQIADKAKQEECGYCHTHLTASVGGVACRLPVDWRGLAAKDLVARLVDMADGLMYECKRTKVVHVRHCQVRDGQLCDFYPEVLSRQ